MNVGDGSNGIFHGDWDNVDTEWELLGSTA